MTFYKYFPNKNTLAEYIVRSMMQEGWEKLDHVEAMPIPFTEKLQHMLTYKLAVMSQMCDDFIEEWLQMPFLEEERQKWLKRVMQFLIDAQRREDIRPDIRPEFILVMAEHLQKLADDERLTSLYPDYAEFTREIWNFFYYGIVERKEN
jgi:AcrR family transcriptional regulator